MEILELPF
ncbi:hypothetical protein LINPERPRIM_LOCUS40418 [Linum perenne]